MAFSLVKDSMLLGIYEIEKDPTAIFLTNDVVI